MLSGEVAIDAEGTTFYGQQALVPKLL